MVSGLGWREACRRRGQPVELKVQADTTARSAAARGADAEPVRVSEEVEVVRAQPLVADVEIRVAIHAELHEGHLLVKIAEHRLCRCGAAISRSEPSAGRTAGGYPAAGTKSGAAPPARGEESSATRRSQEDT